MNKLQVIVITFSVVIAITALLIFAGILPGFRATQVGQAGEISFWGTIPRESLVPALNEFSQKFRGIRVEYREMDPRAYYDDLVKAIAESRGPDVFLLSSEQITKHKALAYVLDSKTYPTRLFRDNFADISRLYETSEGIIGLPLTIDPLVLYWNRSLFRNAGLTQPPRFWDEFLTSTQDLTIKDGQRIIQAGSALGEFSNIKNAKDVLSLLILQTGNKITDPETLRPVFSEKSSEAILNPAEEALMFFTSFADPAKTNHTWSRAQAEAIDAFGAEQLAMYIGYATDMEQILALNPHIDFDATEVPQIRDGRLQATHGRSMALVANKQSPDIATALTFMYEFTGSRLQSMVAQNSFFAPASRSVLAESQENPTLDVFYRSAIRSLGWLDPDPAATLNIWKETVESINSGARRPDQAVSDASRKFEALIQAP